MGRTAAEPLPVFQGALQEGLGLFLAQDDPLLLRLRGAQGDGLVSRWVRENHTELNGPVQQHAEPADAVVGRLHGRRCASGVVPGQDHFRRKVAKVWGHLAHPLDGVDRRVHVDLVGLARGVPSLGVTQGIVFIGLQQRVVVRRLGCGGHGHPGTPIREAPAHLFGADELALEDVRDLRRRGRCARFRAALQNLGQLKKMRGDLLALGVFAPALGLPTKDYLVLDSQGFPGLVRSHRRHACPPWNRCA